MKVFTRLAVAGLEKESNGFSGQFIGKCPEWRSRSEQESTNMSNLGPRDPGYVINKGKEAWKRGSSWQEFSSRTSQWTCLAPAGTVGLGSGTDVSVQD